MKNPSDLLDRLPELPVELFEQAGKLDYSEFEPLITVRPNPLPDPKPPVIPTPHAPRPQALTHYYYCQYIYPRVMCYSTGDPVATARLRLESNHDGLKDGVVDRAALARSRAYYKLTKLGGIDLNPFYICNVHYGPFLAYVEEEEACDTNASSRWTFMTSNNDIVLIWFGTWQDIPAYPNLTVIMGDLVEYKQPQIRCCGNTQWCPWTQSCISTQLDCKPPQL